MPSPGIGSAELFGGMTACRPAAGRDDGSSDAAAFSFQHHDEFLPSQQTGSGSVLPDPYFTRILKTSPLSAGTVFVPAGMHLVYGAVGSLSRNLSGRKPARQTYSRILLPRALSPGIPNIGMKNEGPCPWGLRSVLTCMPDRLHTAAHPENPGSAQIPGGDDVDAGPADIGKNHVLFADGQRRMHIRKSPHAVVNTGLGNGLFRFN